MVGNLDGGMISPDGGGELLIQQGYVTVGTTRKTDGKTSKRAFSLTEIALVDVKMREWPHTAERMRGWVGAGSREKQVECATEQPPTNGTDYNPEEYPFCSVEVVRTLCAGLQPGSNGCSRLGQNGL